MTPGSCGIVGVGQIGGTLGLALGGLVTRFMKVDAAPPATLTAIAVSVSVGIGVVFGLLPARRASRLDPVEALRYE
jgi:putative ABC transport system permease protein